MATSGIESDATDATAPIVVATAASCWTRLPAPECGLRGDESVLRGGIFSDPQLLSGKETCGILNTELPLRGGY